MRKKITDFEKQSKITTAMIKVLEKYGWYMDDDETTSVCNNCKTLFYDDEKYCCKCGIKLKQIELTTTEDQLYKAYLAGKKYDV